MAGDPNAKRWFKIPQELTDGSHWTVFDTDRESGVIVLRETIEEYGLNTLGQTREEARKMADGISEFCAKMSDIDKVEIPAPEGEPSPMIEIVYYTQEQVDEFPEV